MKVAVLGLSRLGAVTAACAATGGHDVTGWDPDPQCVLGLIEGVPPNTEPGLEDLLKAGLTSGHLRFTSDLRGAVSDAEIVWLAFDMPVDSEIQADAEFVIDQALIALPFMPEAAIMLISSQLPVGSCAALERIWGAQPRRASVSFACASASLSFGEAIANFRSPDRVIVGTRTVADRIRLETLFSSFCDHVECMDVESAEMTKHAINAFLATSVAFINEVAALCEASGADTRAVERGMRSDQRIGWSAYLTAGAGYAGGALARDVAFLRMLGRRSGRRTALIDGVETSNQAHLEWVRRQLTDRLGRLSDRTIAIWGLAFTGGADALRGSPSLELCRWLLGQGAHVRAHDPAGVQLPDDLAAVRRVLSPIEAAATASALVILLDWPEYRHVSPDALADAMASGLVIDLGRVLAPRITTDPRFRVVSVGGS